MEKRTLLAFVLSLAVLVFWELYFGLYRMPEPPPQQESAPMSTPAPATEPKVAPGITSESLPPQALPEGRLTSVEQNFKKWTVASSLFDMDIAAPGARINSFRLEKFRTEVNPDSPPMELVPTQATGYFPLAVDLLQHPDWQLSTRSYTSPAPARWSFPEEGQPQSLSFSTEIPGKVQLTKTFTFLPDKYDMDVEVRVKNLSDDKLTDQMGISFYYQPYGATTEDSYNLSRLALYAKGSLSTFAIKDLVEKPEIFKPPFDWVGYENNYFIQALIPLEEQGYQVVPRILDEKKGFIQLVYLTDLFIIDGQQEKSFKMRLYMGPKATSRLEQAGHHLPQAIDYGWFTVLAKPCFTVLEWLYKYTHNYGIAIILITIMIKIVFWPLTQKSYQSMQVMKKIQPKIAAVREKYKDDREKLNQELMGVYKTYKVNPLGGCLPMVLQIPVFFALYRMLYGAVELRHEPFMFWINDLTAPDRLNIGFPIPYLGGIPVLTILMGISMFFQQKMTPSGGDPRQEKLMLMMPVVFTVFFVNFPSGLVLYWLVNNILSIAQQYWINRKA